MSVKVWIIRSIVLVQLVSALSILRQYEQLNQHSRESGAQVKRRTSFVEKMLLETFDQDSKSSKKYGNRTALRQSESTEVPLQKQEKEQMEEQELTKMSRGSLLSELLGKPYVETRGRNDYLVIQSNSVDPFVTVVPNSIYYGIEKKCVNWLDSCSLRGIRQRLLEKVSQ